MYIYSCPNCGNSKGFKSDDNCPACGYLHPKELEVANEDDYVQITFCPDCACHYSSPCPTHQAHLRKPKVSIKDTYAKDDAKKTMENWAKIISNLNKTMPIYSSGSPWPSNPLNKIKP